MDTRYYKRSPFSRLHREIKHQKIMEFLVKFINEKGYSPTVREITKALGISSTSVTDNNLTKLEFLGYIKREQKHSRTIKLLEPVSKGELIKHFSLSERDASILLAAVSKLDSTDERLDGIIANLTTQLS